MPRRHSLPPDLVPGFLATAAPGVPPRIESVVPMPSSEVMEKILAGVEGEGAKAQ
jgi:hypothetical protein